MKSVNANISDLFRIFDRDVADLERVVKDYPASSLARMLLVKKYKESDDSRLQDFKEETALYTSNIPWYMFVLAQPALTEDDAVKDEDMMRGDRLGDEDVRIDAGATTDEDPISDAAPIPEGDGVIDGEAAHEDQAALPAQELADPPIAITHDETEPTTDVTETRVDPAPVESAEDRYGAQPSQMSPSGTGEDVSESHDSTDAPAITENANDLAEPQNQHAPDYAEGDAAHKDDLASDEPGNDAELQANVTAGRESDVADIGDSRHSFDESGSGEAQTKNDEAPAVSEHLPEAVREDGADTIDNPARDKNIAAENKPREAAADLDFEPLHTIDYFASQGIKLREEDLKDDKLTQQVKSFTGWLKSMKQLHPGKLPEQDEVIQRIIQNAAEVSNVEANVLTEAMADVLVKQNKKEKAVEMYEKLSLMNPSKSAYFAAKIQNLKST